MLKIQACMKPNASNFREQHKAQVKNLFQKIHQRNMDRVQTTRGSKDQFMEDIKLFHIDTLKLMTAELGQIIEKLESVEEDAKST